MRTITIPENIQLIDPISNTNGEIVEWKRWFMVCILNDQRMGGNPVQLVTVMRIVNKVKSLLFHDNLELEDDEYSICKPIVENPNINLGGPLLMMQLHPFFEAFLEAKKS